MPLRVRVPASTSNLGPGFDSLGMAVEWLLTVEVEPSAGGLEVSVAGRDAEAIPRGPENLICTSVCRALGRDPAQPPALRVHIQNEIPIGRGLGSSGAAIVAGLIAGTLLAGQEVEPIALLTAATALEGHPDNVAPALLGGLVASATTKGRVHAVPLPLPADLELLLVVPGWVTSTHAARDLLPAQVPFADAVHNLAHTALLIGALAGGDWPLLRPALHDRLHQERRLQLVPGLAAALAALDAEPGCAGAALSGSGPTLVGFVRAGSPASGQAAAAILAGHGITSQIQRLRPHLAGATWEADGSH